MEAEDLNLQDIFTGEDQYIIPVFQRQYSWEKEHWKALWDDISILLDSDLGEDEHFIGAFVMMSAGNRPGSRPQYLVIDGQQRLITLSILLCAIRDKASEVDTYEDDELSDKQKNELNQLPEKVQKKYLVDEFKDGVEKYRILSRAEDRDELFTLVDQEKVDDGDSISQSYSYFYEKIEDMVKQRGDYSLEKLKNIVLEQLPFAMITASEEENPYTIFETLNERGLRLEESDLIRNYVFMQLDFKEQNKFNQEKWMPFEQKFSETQDHSAESLTRFYRMYLMRNGKYVKKNNIYAAFRDRINLNPHRLVEDLDHFSDIYLSIKRPSDVGADWLEKRLNRIQYLDIGTADPLLIHLLDQWHSKKTGEDELKKIFNGLESFAIRRSICDRSTRGYYQIFPSAINSIQGDDVAASLFSYLGDRGWPENDEFKSSFVAFDLYSREPEKCRLILETLQQNYGHKEPVKLENLQIEHVMPQKIGENEHGKSWRSMLGENWEQLHEDWLHTPGNLTLTGYNPELSNKNFTYKQDLFRNSKVDLNEHFLEVGKWSELEIRDRAEAMAHKVAKIWPVPNSATAKKPSLDHSYNLTLFDDDVPVETFEDTTQIDVIRAGVKYLLENGLLDEISIPYIPGTGEGDRAFLNSKPKHADGSTMDRRVEINGFYLYDKLNSEDKRRYFRGLARKCGLVCRFDGNW